MRMDTAVMVAQSYAQREPMHHGVALNSYMERGDVTDFVLLFTVCVNDKRSSL